MRRRVGECRVGGSGRAVPWERVPPHQAAGFTHAFACDGLARLGEVRLYGNVNPAAAGRLRIARAPANPHRTAGTTHAVLTKAAIQIKMGDYAATGIRVSQDACGSIAKHCGVPRPSEPNHASATVRAAYRSICVSSSPKPRGLCRRRQTIFQRGKQDSRCRIRTRLNRQATCCGSAERGVEHGGGKSLGHRRTTISILLCQYTCSKGTLPTFRFPCLFSLVHLRTKAAGSSNWRNANFLVSGIPENSGRCLFR